MKSLYQLTQEVNAGFKQETVRLGREASERYKAQHGTYPSDPFVLPTWMLRTFVPIPSQWPPKEKSLVQYAYAGALRLGLCDAEIVGNIFAKAEIHLAEQSFGITLLADSIAEIGIQGVRPLNADEARISAHYETVFNQLEQAVLTSDACIPPETRAYFNLLKNTTGLMYEKIRNRHLQFFEFIEM